MAVTYTAPTDEALGYIADNMRAADVEELCIMGCQDPRKAVFSSAEGSDACFVTWVGDTPAAVLGVGSVGMIGGTGAPWLLGTDGLVHCKRQFLTDGRDIIGSWRRRYALLQNAVAVNNHMSVRWLRYVGARFNPPTKTAFGGQIMSFYIEGDRRYV